MSNATPLRVLLVLALTACGAASPPVEPASQSAAAPPPPATEPVATSAASAPEPWAGPSRVTSFEGVVSRATAIYVANLTTRSRRGENELCVVATGRQDGRADPLPARSCVPMGQIDVALAGAPALGSNAHVLVAMQTIDDRTLPVAWSVSPASDSGARDELVTAFQCAQAARFWRTIPDADRVCAADADCGLVRANCLDEAVSASRIAHYERAMQELGPPCGEPEAGACPTRSLVAACRDARCSVVVR